MCVRLALQVLSKSVSEALICCEREMKLPQFQGASATAEFCAYFNDAFDAVHTIGQMQQVSRIIPQHGNQGQQTRNQRFISQRGRDTPNIIPFNSRTN